MMLKWKWVLSVTLLVISLAWVFSDASASRSPVMADNERMAVLLPTRLSEHHLNKVAWGDAIAAQGLTNFLETLDFEKIFFLATDIETFREQQFNLDDQVKRGELDFARDVFAVYKQRVDERVAFAEKLLDEPMDFTADEEYEWKRNDAAWPADQAAADDLWRKRIKHLYLSQLISRENGDDDTAVSEEDKEKQTHSDKVNAALEPAEFVRRALKRYQTVVQDNDETWLLEIYLTSFARAYDPHTDFMSPNNMEDFEINMRLSLEGIGAILSSEDGAAKIERLIPGGPAELDGRLKPGDKIIAVAQGDEEAVDVLHWPLYKTVRLIRGEKGSRVVLTIIPNSNPASLEKIDIIRDEVKLEDQAAKGELRTITDETGASMAVGVITLPEFYADFKGGKTGESTSCSRDVRRIIKELQDQGAVGMVLDLRNNGGGSLVEAVNLTGLFIGTGPVVQVRDRNTVRALRDDDPDIAYDGPLVVMVNRLSASASEIVAGALQDYGRAIIVGDSKTHGKGTVQTLIAMHRRENLGSLKVTTASFYRIAGGSTQIMGVKPDIIIPSVVETLEVGEDLLDNALPYTTVERLNYRPWRGGNPDLVPALQSKSGERRGTDARFQSFNDLMARMKERQDSNLITLNLEKRRAFAASEKELRDKIEEINPETGKKDDIILGEALNIMRDIIATETGKAIADDKSKPSSTAASL